MSGIDDGKYAPIDSSILRDITNHAADIRFFSEVVGIPELAFVAPVARESNKILNDYKTDVLRQTLQVTTGYNNVSGKSNSRLVSDYELTKSGGFTKGNSGKAVQLVDYALKDYGPGKISVLEAVDALLFYDKYVNDGSDPFKLHEYVENLKNDNSPKNMRGFILDYKGDRGDSSAHEMAIDLTLKLSAVIALKNKTVIDQRFGKDLYKNLNNTEKTLLLTSAYTTGVEKFVSLVEENITKNNHYVPNLTISDGSAYIFNNNNMYRLTEALSNPIIFDPKPHYQHVESSISDSKDSMIKFNTTKSQLSNLIFNGVPINEQLLSNYSASSTIPQIALPSLSNSPLGLTINTIYYYFNKILESNQNSADINKNNDRTELFDSVFKKVLFDKNIDALPGNEWDTSVGTSVPFTGIAHLPTQGKIVIEAGEIRAPNRTAPTGFFNVGLAWPDLCFPTISGPRSPRSCRHLGRARRADDLPWTIGLH